MQLLFKENCFSDMFKKREPGTILRNSNFFGKKLNQYYQKYFY